MPSSLSQTTTIQTSAETIATSKTTSESASSAPESLLTAPAQVTPEPTALAQKTMELPRDHTTIKPATSQLSISEAIQPSRRDLHIAQSGIKNLHFRLIIRIKGFSQDNFNCEDPDLQNQSSATYRFFSVSCSLITPQLCCCHIRYRFHICTLYQK